MSAINKVPLFKFNAAFATTLNIGYILDNVVCYPVPREGSEVTQTPAGAEDSWYVGTDFIMECDVRWVPESNTTNPTADGFSVGTAWDAFFLWGRQKGLIRYQPDKAVGATFVDGYLIEPWDGDPRLEPDGTQTYHLKLRAATSYATARAAV